MGMCFSEPKVSHENDTSHRRKRLSNERQTLRRARAQNLEEKLCSSTTALDSLDAGVDGRQPLSSSVEKLSEHGDNDVRVMDICLQEVSPPPTVSEDSRETDVTIRKRSKQKDSREKKVISKKAPSVVKELLTKMLMQAGMYERTISHYDEVDHKACSVEPADWEFPFENLVLEGGGNKGLAYCGAVRYLEEMGMMPNIKRLAGASAGGMMAALLAVGYNSYEVEEFLADRIDRIFLDASCGYMSFLPNLLARFGWNPGRRIYEWFGDKMKDKTGDPDVTFRQLYQKLGRVLCIVVTNVSQMTTEYCHPKTTPDMPIRLAVRMTMAFPVMFSAMKFEHHGQTDVYVDGGVLCNYPIHCFDGWYLSMAPEDSFVRRLQPLKDIPVIMERNNRFGTFNHKTLGMLLYADGEEDILRYRLERRAGCLNPKKPRKQTRLYIQRMKQAKIKQRAEREHAKVVQAVDAFLRVLKKHNIDHNDIISKTELEAAFKDETEFPKDKAEILFGKGYTVHKAFELLDKDQNGLIRYDELVEFIEENGVSLQTRFLGYERKEITNLLSFLESLQNTLIYNVKRLYVEERDLDRTVGINTGHVSTGDFRLDEADRDFVVERGYNSMKSFLQYYVVTNKDRVKMKCPPGLPEESGETPPRPKKTSGASQTSTGRSPLAKRHTVR